MAGTADQRIYLSAGIRAVQSTLLFSRSGKLLGMISTYWDHPHEPTEAELRNLDILARQAADIIERQAHRADDPAESSVAGGTKTGAAAQ